MADFDDGTIFQLITARIVQAVGLGVSVFMPGEAAPDTAEAYITFDDVDLDDESQRVGDSAEGPITLSGMVCVSDAYAGDTGKGRYAHGSIVAKLRSTLRATGLQDAGLTHTINFDLVMVRYAGRDEKRGLRVATWRAEGRVVRNSGSGCVVDYSA